MSYDGHSDIQMKFVLRICHQKFHLVDIKDKFDFATSIHWTSSADLSKA